MTGNGNWTETPHGRAGLAVVLLAVLLGLLVAAGTISHDPANNSFADEDEWGPTPETYVGEYVFANGEVVATDPIVIKVAYSENRIMEVTVEHTETGASEGQEFGVFGTLADERTIEAERTHHRDQWESQYMYVISFLGGMLVFVRILLHWTPDRTHRGFVPRGERDA